MDREQEEMQFLGLWGIYTESYKIIISFRKIFSQITLALIVPLTFIFLSQIEVSEILLSKITRNEIQLEYTPTAAKQYDRLTDHISSELTTLYLFKFVYFTFLLVLSLLSTSAVVYTIASVYTARDVTFKKVMTVVPKVWKRVMVTFLCSFLAFLSYNLVWTLFLIMWLITVDFKNNRVTDWGVFIIAAVAYTAGILYMTIVWQLASVVSVLEDLKGFKAMVKSQGLIKGKTWTAAAIFFKLNLAFTVVHWIFERFVVHGAQRGAPVRVLFGLLCSLLLFKLFLFQLVVQTVFYFVCKSYHHENIDKSNLSDHLEVYLGEYVPLKTKDVQLENFQV